MKNPAKLLVSAVILIVTSYYAAAQTYDIRLNLKKGQKYDQSMVMNMTMAETMAGQDIKVGTKAKFIFAQEVKSIDKDGNYIIESAYKRLAMDVDAMGTSMSYDSDKKAGSKNDAGSEELEKTFKGIIGKKYTITISPKGKVLKVEGMKAIIDDLSKSASPTTVQMLSSTFDDKKMAATYASSYDFFPDQAVKVGDTWKRRTTIESIFPMDVESAYTLKSVNGSVATIGMAADIAMKKDDLEMQGVTAKVDLKGNYTGDYHLDLTTGLGTTASLSMPISGTMEVMGTVVPLTISSTVETSVMQGK